jgi:3-deoxy-D-manno-octulosonate 8-phosphate phosphatase (KDO 8-P phosphatase)
MKIDIRKFENIVFDFDGVFTDNSVYVNSDGAEFVKCNRSDSLGLNLFRAYLKSIGHQMNLAIVSTEANGAVDSRAKKIGLDCHQGIGNKLAFLLGNQVGRNDTNLGLPLDLSKTIYLGNDLNDLAVMQSVGLSFAPSDSHPLVKAVATHVSQELGGQGFVRSVLELLMDLPKLSERDLNELISNS